MEVDVGDETGLVAKATCLNLDRLEAAVEALGRAVADPEDDGVDDAP